MNVIFMAPKVLNARFLGASALADQTSLVEGAQSAELDFMDFQIVSRAIVHQQQFAILGQVTVFALLV